MIPETGLMSRLMRRLMLVIVLCFVASACASSKSTAGSSGSTTPGASLPHKAGMGAGVTAKQINLGVVLIDFKCIPDQFVDEERPDQKKAYQAFIDDINAKGGINGR